MWRLRILLKLHFMLIYVPLFLLFLSLFLRTNMNENYEKLNKTTVIYPKALIYRLSWWSPVFIASATARVVHSRRRQDRRKVFMRKQIGGTGI